VSRFVLNSDSKTEVDNDGHIPYRKAVQAEAGTSFLPANGHSYFRESSCIVKLFSLLIISLLKWVGTSLASQNCLPCTLYRDLGNIKD
jgi:hypothetical protein